MFLLKCRMFYLECRMRPAFSLILLNKRLNLIFQRMKLVAKFGRHWRLRVSDDSVIQFLEMEREIHRVTLRLNTLYEQAKNHNPLGPVE